LPPIAAYWEGRDIDIRREVGLIPTDEDADRVRSERETERRALVHLLERENLVPSGESPKSLAELCGAVGFLPHPGQAGRTVLDDLASEIEPVNAGPATSFRAGPGKCASRRNDSMSDEVRPGWVRWSRADEPYQMRKSRLCDVRDL
jgi:hypothetical protein